MKPKSQELQYIRISWTEIANPGAIEMIKTQSFSRWDEHYWKRVCTMLYVLASCSVKNTCYMLWVSFSGCHIENCTINWENSVDCRAPHPTSEAISDTRLHSFYFLFGVWQIEAEWNPKTRTWAAAQHSKRWHFINAMKQNTSCSLMTPFREKGPQCWPALILITHWVPSILFWHDIIRTVPWSQRTAGYGTAMNARVVFVQQDQEEISTPDQLGVPLMPGTAWTRLFKDANGSRVEAWLEGRILLGDQTHRFPIISLGALRGKKARSELRGLIARAAQKLIKLSFL